MRKFRNTLTVMTIILSVSFAGWSAAVQAEEGSVQKIEEKKMPESEFINLFHNTRWGTWKNISDEVSPYLMGKSEDEALQFLKEQGFEASEFSNQSEIERLKQHYKQENGFELDKIYFATRGPGWQFWRILTDYQVHIFTKNGKVIHVTAVVHGFFAKF